MHISDEVIAANIAQLNANIITNLLKASAAQVCGATITVNCHLDKVFDNMVAKEELESLCPTNVPVYDQNIALLCDLENDKGIGEWAIERSLRGCNIFKIRFSQQPPPYGEFSFCEHQTNNYTEPVGDTGSIVCN